MTLMSWLILLFLLIWFVGAVRRIRLWRSGQPDPVSLLAGLIAMPRRYLVDLHHVVARDRRMSHTHVATAGGFVAAMVVIILVHLFGLHSKWLSGLLLVTTAVMFTGAVFVWRRRQHPPSRLSKGAWMRLPRNLMLFSATFFLITLADSSLLPAGTFSVAIVTILTLALIPALGEMLFGMTWGGPMKHAFAGALHLAFHRRSERFGGGRSTGLKPLDLQQPQLGVAKPTDFTWNQLLGFDACVQCGRCEQMCPAFAAGQPLNPKKFIQDMVIGMAGGNDHSYAGNHHPGRSSGQASGGPTSIMTEGLLTADTIWSCTTCRACVEECPMMIEHVDAIVDLRRFLTLETGQTPNKGAETLENLIATDNPGGHDPSRRTHWAADLNLPLMAEVKQAEVLFWVSDGAFDLRSQRILRAFVTLLRSAGIDFAVLGDEEIDCGDVARRLGDEATFQLLARQNIRTLNQYRFNRIVTTDPHAFHCLKNEYRDFIGGHYEVLHHTTFLEQLVSQGKLTLKPATAGNMTYHDPCYLGRYNGEYDAPRSLLNQLGIPLKEMERSGFRSRCCGGGGGAPITDIPGQRRIPDMRMDDARAVSAETVIVACQQCTAMLEGVVEPRPAVKDIAELLVEHLRVE
ncbi:(Fe-S)-binding protein [Gynuella sunshinyii]|uniref:Fe-S oxidoreductase n=1 Tax=Gynuella sunshinyii YC6258 TaxID=1445510 RepID=A0A0C5VGY6_9GAMM|nr:(Fe-S)-binding protein [Gynuella sunshinyii]AJQ93491.1 Fe-S oxidoreductase [Gynuella sunshinyii YC6258]